MSLYNTANNANNTNKGAVQFLDQSIGYCPDFACNTCAKY